MPLQTTNIVSYYNKEHPFISKSSCSQKWQAQISMRDFLKRYYTTDTINSISDARMKDRISFCSITKLEDAQKTFDQAHVFVAKSLMAENIYLREPLPLYDDKIADTPLEETHRFIRMRLATYVKTLICLCNKLKNPVDAVTNNDSELRINAAKALLQLWDPSNKTKTKQPLKEIPLIRNKKRIKIA